MSRFAYAFLALLAFTVPPTPAFADDAPAAGGDAKPGAGGNPALLHEEAEGDEAPLQWGRGPIEVSDPYVVALYRARPWATSPALPGHLGGEISLRGLWANSYTFQTGRYAIDAETRHGLVTARLGIGDRFALGVHAEYQWRGGGKLDGFIEGFHHAFGLPNGDRGRRKRDRFFVAGVQADGTVYQQRHRGYGFSDLTLEGRAQLLKGGALLPALTATLRLRLPVGRGKFHLSDSVDPTLQLDASKRLGRLPIVLYSGFGYTYHAHARVDGLDLYRHRVFGYFGFELELRPWLSFVIHAWWESARERELWRDRAGIARSKLIAGNYVTYVALGFKAEPTKGVIFELGILENIFDPEVTADFGIIANLTLKF